MKVLRRYFRGLGSVTAKIVSGQVALSSGKPWAYLSKFSYSLGTGNFTLEVTEASSNRQKPTPSFGKSNGARFFLYLDEDWEDALTAPTCQEKLKFAKWQSASLRSAPPLKHAVSQSIRPHFWYFVLADCEAEPSATLLNYRLKMYNADGSHFSHEEKAPSRLLPVLAVGFLISMGPLLVLLQSYRSRTRGQRLHPSILNLGAALLLFLTSLALETVNYWVYAKNGEGLRLTDIGAELANWLAQLVVSLELLSIAWVWSVDTVLTPSRKQRAGRSIMYRMVGGLVVLHVACILLGRVYDDAHSKYHESETVWALGLIGMRLLLGGLFAAGVQNLLVRENNLLQRTFLMRLGALGGAYFISIPVVITVASTFFARYLRHQVVTVGSAAVQVFSLVGLSILLLTRNEYTELSSLSSCSLPSIKLA
ncbi:hypothetical protein NSK_004971 [Nannochloropsis salina CCMP1776]|uniref:GPR180/TMEM145 transmembrane domain-containing protein n=1 Tax=Nannochloropsis salina CCMP1776 TaxID=1027361 RepID=A0A4D9CZ92_9STRA|nr:hypothetical protein NSK_004971 [Nannochloropsis salina CCMP1776]|eukprot:TFJ83874.1 hypothetical protein NSK_004971 [Nannochloropsis salina CCMP1776]